MSKLRAIFYNDSLADYYPGDVLGEIYGIIGQGRQGVYKPYLDGKEGLIILDIGGNAGWTTNYFSDHASKVFTVEPSKEHCDIINELVKFNKLENVTLIQAAVSNTPGEMKLNHNNNKTMFSLSPEVADTSLPSETVRVTTIEEIMKENNLDHIDLMKLDPEGEEGKILCGDSFARIADKIDTIIFEYHSWCGYNPDQIRTCMKDLGFSWHQMPSEASVYVCSRIK